MKKLSSTNAITIVSTTSIRINGTEYPAIYIPKNGNSTNTVNLNDIAGNVLQQFPEVYQTGVAGAYCTTNGYTIFVSSSATNANIVSGYNMFETDTTVSLNSINPDISELKKSDMLNNPLAVRRLYVESGVVKPEYSYSIGDNNHYSYYNCDYIKNGAIITNINGDTNNEGYGFKVNNFTTIYTPCFDYKPMILIRQYNTNGTALSTANTSVQVKYYNSATTTAADMSKVYTDTSDANTIIYAYYGKLGARSTTAIRYYGIEFTDTSFTGILEVV